MKGATAATLGRDLRVWRQRAGECRHPLVLGSALFRCAQRRRLLAFATGRPASETGIYVREAEDDTPFLAEVRGALARRTTYAPRAVDFMLPRRWGSVFFNEVTLPAGQVGAGASSGPRPGRTVTTLTLTGRAVDVAGPPADSTALALGIPGRPAASAQV